MRNYELTLIFSGDLKAEQLTLALEEIISLVQGKGGILLNQEIRGKRALLSPIKNHKEGNLAALKFTTDASTIEEVKKHLKENQNILRFLCLVSVSRKVKAKTPHLFEPEPQSRRLAPQIGSLPAMPKERTGEETRSIDLGDIDKKLEEIFKKL
jgi:ribosomal protein S6